MEIKAICLLVKIILLLIGLLKNNTIFAKYIIDFYILSRDAILFLVEKKKG